MFFVIIYSDEDRDIITRIYEEHGGMMLKVAHRYLSGEDAEDALHDIMEKLAEKNKISKLCDNGRRFFVIVAKNHCIDVLRRQKGERIDMPDDDSVFQDSSFDPAEILAKESEKEAMAQFILRLRPNYREVLEYKYILGYDNHEIATILGVTPSVISTRLDRARRSLKKTIEKAGDPSEVQR